jgi:hypothetical protein
MIYHSSPSSNLLRELIQWSVELMNHIGSKDLLMFHGHPESTIE